MKLRNKKTGEIGNLVLNINPNRESYVVLSTGNGDTICGNLVIGDYDTLAELNEEWEDYEEPKEFWFVDSGGEVEEATYLTDNDKSKLRNFGNYFETKEEAEEAVRRLKAWKRLKDYNVKFNLDFVKNKIDFTYTINNPLLGVLDGEEQIFNNMKIVFGGEE